MTPDLSPDVRDPRLQRTLDELLVQIRSTRRQAENVETSLGGLVSWLDSDVEGFRMNRSFVDARDEVERAYRALRNLERIAKVWGAI